MAEILTEVKTYRVTYDCDECGDEVVYSGTYNPTSPPKCHHKCQGCGKKYVFLTMYPNTIYKEV